MPAAGLRALALLLLAAQPCAADPTAADDFWRARSVLADPMPDNGGGGGGGGAAGAPARGAAAQAELAAAAARPRCGPPPTTVPARAAPVPHDCGWDAPVLWSYPGSGNTWMRLLLERATGFATGSVYNDPSLLPLFVHEDVCAPRVLVVKAHAVHTPYELLRAHAVRHPPRSPPAWHGGAGDGPSATRALEPTLSHFRRKCAWWRPARALILDRNPFEAIWSEYQRAFAAGDNGGHVTRIGRGAFSRAHWLQRSAAMASDFVAAWAAHGAFARDEGTAVARVPFEALRTACAPTLERAIAWLAPPGGASAQRVRAAAAAACAGDPRAPAARNGSATGEAAIHRPTASGNVVHTTDAWDELAACRAWAALAHAAEPLGYAPPRGLACASRDQLLAVLATARRRGGEASGAVVLLRAHDGELDVALNWLLSAPPAVAAAAALGADTWRGFDALGALGAPVFPLLPPYSAQPMAALWPAADGAGDKAPRNPRDAAGHPRREGSAHARGEATLGLLRAGHAVALADADALWPTDARGALARAAAGVRADLVAVLAPSAHAGPPAASLRLARWAPTAGACSLLEAALARSAAEGGDEGGLNALLRDNGRASAWAGGTLVEVTLTADRPPARVLLLADAERALVCAGPSAGALARPAPTARGGTPSAAALAVGCAVAAAEGGAPAPPSRELGGELAQRLRRGGLWRLPTAWLAAAPTAAARAGGAAPPALPATVAAASDDGRFAAMLGRLRAADASAALPPPADGFRALAIVLALAAPAAPPAAAAAAADAAAVGARLQRFVEQVADGATAAALATELIVVDWAVDSAAAASAPPPVAPALPAARGGGGGGGGARGGLLSIRRVQVDARAHTLALRRHAKGLRTLVAGALNVGVRLARAELIFCVDSLAVELFPSFFHAARALHDARAPAAALAAARAAADDDDDDETAAAAALRGGLRAYLVGGCVLRAPPHAAAGRAEPSEHCAAGGGVDGAFGLLMPAALWHAARGIPEGVLTARHADRYLDNALRRLNAPVAWLPCACAAAAATTRARRVRPPPAAGCACARVVAAAGHGRWWRLGAAALPKTDSVRGAQREHHAPQPAAAIAPLDAEREVELLRIARAGGGLDSVSCRWGLAGLTLRVAEAAAADAAAAPAAASVSVPVLAQLGDAPPAGGCIARGADGGAWAAWSAHASVARPMLVVQVEGGLGNRLRALVSGWALADALGYLYTVVWEANIECNARYDELFEPDARFLALGAKPAAWPAADWVEYAMDDQAPTLAAAHSRGTSVYIRTQHFVRSRAVGYSLQAVAERYAWLRPRANLDALGAWVARRARASEAIGVHVRFNSNESAQVFGLADVAVDDAALPTVAASHFNAQSADAIAAYATRRARCHWRTFAPTLVSLSDGARQRVARRGASADADAAPLRRRFVVACDDASCLDGLRAAVERSGGDVVAASDYLPRQRATDCSADSRSAPCQALALVELLLLARTQHLLLSQPSSFSDAARFLLYGRWLVTYGVDTRLPGPFAWRATIHCGEAVNFGAFLHYEGMFAKAGPAGGSLPLAKLIAREASARPRLLLAAARRPNRALADRHGRRTAAAPDLAAGRTPGAHNLTVGAPRR